MPEGTKKWEGIVEPTEKDFMEDLLKSAGLGLKGDSN